MFKMAIRHKDRKINHGNGCRGRRHGRNANEIIHRVQGGGQGTADAIVAATSLKAEALGLQGMIGTARARHGSRPESPSKAIPERHHGAAAGVFLMKAARLSEHDRAVRLI